MAQKYITLSEEALDKLLALVRESHSVAEGIDDENVATNSTYSSAKLQELLGDAGVQAIELTKAEYDALSDEEKNSETIYFIKDTEVANEITIVTELDETSTDTQIPSAKTIYDIVTPIDYSEQLTYAEGYTGSAYAQLYRIGNLVFYSDIIEFDEATNKQVTIVFIPEELRPTDPVILHGHGYDGTNYTTLDMITLRGKNMSPNPGGIIVQGSISIQQARVGGMWVID